MNIFYIIKTGKEKDYMKATNSLLLKKGIGSEKLYAASS